MSTRADLAPPSLTVVPAARTKHLICLDFDGVINSSRSRWKGAGVVDDEPVPGTGAFLLSALARCRVAVFSSRSRSLSGRRAMRRYVRSILWDACLTDTAASEAARQATQGTPPEYIPWTAYDVRDVADHIGSKIEWPWFKPAAFVTIDDRAITFTGQWPSVAEVMAFKPWNKL